MKTNLKNFPLEVGGGNIDTLLENMFERSKWKQDFEAELREIIEDYKNHGELRYSAIELVKEVLGEKDG